MIPLHTLRTVHRVNYRFFLLACRPKIIKCPLRSKSLFVEVSDALDVFTTQLIQKKLDKWGSSNTSGALTTILTDTSSNKSSINNVKCLNAKEIDKIFQDALDEYDKNKISLLVKACKDNKYYPSVSVLVKVLSFFAQQGDIEGVKDIKEFCKAVYPDFVSAYSDFHHYLAEAIWLRGNVTKAIELFDAVYKTNTLLRRHIRLSLRYLINEAVKNRSEAVMVSITRFCKSLSKEHKDSFPLVCLWQVCFLSEWHTDQCIALKLMEKNVGFCKTVINRIPYVISALLKNQRTEPVYRLLEILLKHDFKMQCSIVLVALFDYRYRQGDLMRCLEIYNWSMKYNLTLPTIQHEKFLKLLLNHDKGSAAKTKKQASPPKFHLKF